MIIGYKCFKKGLINNYGNKFEIGRVYSVNGPTKFGINGNGYHLCLNFEDTFRYMDTAQEIELCVVFGFGDKTKYDDEYCGYYDMYAVQNLFIINTLSRDDIIHMALNLDSIRIVHFLQTFKLSKEEILLFKEHFNNNQYILDLISYYQEKDLEVFKRKLNKK